MMKLKEICESVGVSRRSIQCYEKAGLMEPTDKNKYGHLLYDENALHRAKLIRFLQELGFKLRDIKEIIDAPRKEMRDALEKRIQELEIETAQLEQIILEAKEYIRALR